jgi:hypothetical protein
MKLESLLIGKPPEKQPGNVAAALSGNVIGAENYYQHAEHYFRSMSSDRGTT